MSHLYVNTDENRFKEVNFNTEGNLLEEVFFRRAKLSIHERESGFLKIILIVVWKKDFKHV